MMSPLRKPSPHEKACHSVHKNVIARGWVCHIHGKAFNLPCDSHQGVVFISLTFGVSRRSPNVSFQIQ
jgi:hypothetical protein